MTRNHGARKVPFAFRAAGHLALAVACCAAGVLATCGSAAASADQQLARGVTRVATVQHTVAGYASPGRHRIATVPATWYGYPSVLPMIELRPGWVRVRLAQRPNGSTAWIPATDVTLGTVQYSIVIDLKTTHLYLYDEGHRILSAPAGVGTPDDPTSLGQFFVAFFEPPPVANVGYGPFVIVTSAHSNAIKDWNGSGDAVMGIHGPLGMDRQIGTKGARISHGCIRLHLSALHVLRVVPPGTPIDIIE
jgi:lipoprotein-anchoring transpeptidase ErfK/SrfK